VVGSISTIAFLALGAQALVKVPSEWLDVYVLAARDLAGGRDIYAPGRLYLYPPFMAFATLPFAWLPPLLSRLAWYFVSVGCTLGLIVFAWRAAGGTPVTRWTGDTRERWALLIGFACSVTYILNTLAHQQTDLIIGFLLIFGCWRLIVGRDVSAGVALGLAAACKATPVLFIPYLAWRGRWVAALAMLAVVTVATLAPQLVAAPPGGGLWIFEWFARYVLPTQHLAAPLGQWGSELIYNQSLGGTLQRWSGEHGGVALKVGLYATLAAMVLATLAAASRARAVSNPELVPSVSLECGAILTLMLLASPMSSPAHFVTLILPAFCLARLALASRDQVLLGFVITAAVLSVLTNRDPLGHWLYGWALWGGTVALSALLLWVGSLWALARRREASA
jgi:hypothetical protein